MGAVAIGPGDFALSLDELRTVTRFAVESAQEVLPVFEHAVPDDPRPRAAVEAAWTFANGADRTRLQRVAALDAHRAAKAAGDGAARHAALAAGDASAAAYLHPIARATQVGHILRAVANAARAAELAWGVDSGAGPAVVAEACRRATPVLIAVLGRYPPAPAGSSRVAQLMTTLDTTLRAQSSR